MDYNLEDVSRDYIYDTSSFNLTGKTISLPTLLNYRPTYLTLWKRVSVVSPCWGLPRA